MAGRAGLVLSMSPWGASEGPGLALILLVVAAGAAALLALGRAVLALYAATRRRTLELAALEAAGARADPLRRSLLIEQAVTLTWAAVRAYSPV